MKTDDARVAEIRAAEIRTALIALVHECQDLAEEVGDQLHAFDKRLDALETAVYRTEAISIKLLESVRRAARRAPE